MDFGVPGNALNQGPIVVQAVGSSSNSPTERKRVPEGEKLQETKSTLDWGEVEELSPGGETSGSFEPPTYPPRARLMGYEGVVLVGVGVVQGRVTETQILKSSGYPVLDEAARDAISKWMFTDKRSSRFTQKITFQLVP